MAWIRLPHEIRERALSLRRQMLALHRDVDASDVDREGERYRSWVAFIRGYGDWLASVTAGTAPDAYKWGWTDVADTIDRYTRELRDWRERWEGERVETTSPAPAEPSADDPWLPKHAPGWLWGVIVVSGVAATAALMGRVRK